MATTVATVGALGVVSRTTIVIAGATAFANHNRIAGRVAVEATITFTGVIEFTGSSLSYRNPLLFFYINTLY